MTVREILKMGDPRLLRIAEPVTEFNTDELNTLIADMFDTMHAANGAGLAAPQIGVNLRVVIYGFKQNVRYPEAPPVPETVLINPKGSISSAMLSAGTPMVFMHVWCSMNAIIWMEFCIRCESKIFRNSVIPKSCFPSWIRTTTINWR
jgi:hypothetical protein